MIQGMDVKTLERQSQNQLISSQTLKTVLRDLLPRDWEERLRTSKKPEDSTQEHDQPAEFGLELKTI